MESTLISKRIKESRNAAKLTQEELGEKVEATKGTISNYENGYSTPSNQMLVNLANVLGVTTDYLLGRDSKSTQNKGTIYLDGVEITGNESIFLLKVLKALRENSK